MARVSSVQKNLKIKKAIDSMKSKRSLLKDKIKNKTLSLDERFELVLKLSSLPRNSSSTRYRNRCALTGRPRGYYRKFNLSRNQLRDMASKGCLTGVVKSSW